MEANPNIQAGHMPQSLPLIGVMKHWMSVTLGSILFCFLLGFLWGKLRHQVQDVLEFKPRKVHILAPKDYLNPRLIEHFKVSENIEVQVSTYLSIKELYEKLSASSEYDLFFFSSIYFDFLKSREVFAPMEVASIESAVYISKDLRHAIWDPEESFALPFSWNILILEEFGTKPLQAESLYDLRAQKEFEEVSVNWIDTPESKVWRALHWGDEPSNENKKNEKQPEVIQKKWSEHLLPSAESQRAPRLWYPKEKLPFYIFYVGIPKKANKKNEIHSFLNLLYQPINYIHAFNEGTGLMVENPSEPHPSLLEAERFKGFPMVHLEPLIPVTKEIEARFF